MKRLSDLRPCDQCDGAIAPMFWVVDLSQALINAKAANKTLGLNQFFGGHALGLAEAFNPTADEAVVVFADKEPLLRTRIVLCESCFLDKDLSLPVLLEKVNHRTGASAETSAPSPDATGHP